LREIRKEGLTGEKLDQAFQEGFEWLGSLPGGELVVRNSDAVVVISGGIITEGMGLGPDKVKGARGLWVHLEFPGAEEEYQISDLSGLKSVTSLGNLRVPTTILGKLPLHGVSKSSDGKDWAWETVNEERYKLVYTIHNGEQELTPEEIESGKLVALKVIYWLKTALA
jgi:hypothetical protein